MSSFVEGLSNRKKMHVDDLIAQKQRQQNISEYVPLTLEQILQMQNVPVQGELLPIIDFNSPENRPVRPITVPAGQGLGRIAAGSMPARGPEILPQVDPARRSAPDPMYRMPEKVSSDAAYDAYKKKRNADMLNAFARGATVIDPEEEGLGAVLSRQGIDMQHLDKFDPEDVNAAIDEYSKNQKLIRFLEQQNNKYE